jgi:hypothetical protein
MKPDDGQSSGEMRDTRSVWLLIEEVQ